VGARELRETISGLREAGKTILLTTHYMFEADELCERLAVIAGGRFVATGTPADLKAAVADQSIVEIETFGVPDAALDRLRAVPGVTAVGVEVRDQAQVVLVQSAVGAELVPSLLRALDGATVGKVIAREPTLEDAYVELVRSA
jgi:ABC-2 type transport system ATP-binding protein